MLNTLQSLACRPDRERVRPAAAPWPDLSALALPGFTPGVLAAAIAGAFLPDLPGMLSGVMAASLFMAYAIMGFAVLHAITRGMASRSLRADRRLLSP